MGLVDYSDSSESEAEAAPQQDAKPKQAVKSSFKKAIQRSNAGKIIVSLPEGPKNGSDPNGADISEPAPKKPRLGGGGFNSFLPAPKKQNPKVAEQRNGLSRGVSLKTSSAPGFSREPAADVQELFDNEESSSFDRGDTVTSSAQTGTEDEIGNSGNVKAVMFKPLSVGAKKKQKKPVQKAKSQLTAPAPRQDDAMPPTPPKATPAPLFSFGVEATTEPTESTTAGAYVPLVYSSKHASEEDPPFDGIDTTGEAQSNTSQSLDPRYETSRNTRAAQSLETVASDLNLSESAKRQLFGRKGKLPAHLASSANVIDFNIDKEYAANEELRQAGETIQHNPVRAIAPGKHSLQQLVNAASNQRDALEDSFASGRRNKKEAGSKYGW